MRVLRKGRWWVDFRKRALSWIKNPLGLMFLLIGVAFQFIASPAFFYIEDNYENLKWVEVQSIKYYKSGGRYGSYDLVVESVDGRGYVFSHFGFGRGEIKKMIDFLNEGGQVGWYSTCFEWRSIKIGDKFLSGGCAVIMEVSRGDFKYISFGDRLELLKRDYWYIFFKIYFFTFCCLIISLACFVKLSKRD